MSIIEVPKVKLGIHPVRVARNGVITSGPAVALLASQLNMIVNRRLKVHFRNWLPVGRVTNAAGDQTTWRWRGHISPNAIETRLRIVTVPAEDTGVIEPRWYISVTPSGGSVYDNASVYVPARVPAATTIVPDHFTTATKRIVKDADLVFMLDTVAPWHPASAGPRPGVKVVALSENPLREELPFWGYRVDLCVTGALQNSMEMLLESMKKRVKRGEARRIKSAESWGKRHEERVRKWKGEALACKQTKPLDTRWVAHELNQVLPADALVVDETITHRPVILSQLDRLRPGTPFAGYLGGLGTGLGTALGVKAAAPERPVIALIGDGSFSYNPVIAALGFAQEYGMPILIVMFNNFGYLSMKRGIPAYFPDGWAVRSKTFVGTSIVPSPDYAAVARAFDGYGETVEEPSEVRASLERGLKAMAEGRLALLDMRLQPVN